MTVTEFDSLPDETLMKRYGEGNAAAFEQLYRRHKGPLFRFLLRQISDRAVSEELFQDIWSKVIAKRGEYHVSAKFTTWLYTIARNRLIDHFRAEGRRPINLDLDDEEQMALENLACAHRPELVLESEKSAQTIKQIVADLPHHQRDAFLLKYESGLNNRDIAEITGHKEETIKSQVRYAINKLKIGLFGGSHE